MAGAQLYNPEAVKQLAEQVLHHKRAYYAGHPEISDFAYDALEEELRRMAPDHPVLRAIGAEPVGSSKKVEHAVPMLSLNKTYVLDELIAWMGQESIVGMLKVDGVSLALIYEDGALKLAKTRGNGRIGEDVTSKAKWIADVLPSIPQAPGLVEIRGELYCTESNFLRLCDEMVAHNLERPASPRNIVAGVLGRKTRFDLARFFSFFAFDVLGEKLSGHFQTEMDKFAWLAKAGFPLPDQRLLHSPVELEGYLNHVKDLMNEGEIGLDGAVCSYNRLALHAEMGNTSHHPRYKIAFKWQGETAVSKIDQITWATSRLGIVTPVAVIEPVYLSGAKITNVTLHNAALVRTFNLKVGDRIEVVRSGEVIPKFLSVVEARQGLFRWPRQCPSCSHELVFDDVRLKCPNPEGCPAQKSRSMLNWIRSAGIDDLSEKRLESMLELGLVRDIPDLYRLSMEDMLRLPLTKEKMAKKLFDNIRGSTRLPLANFLNGLGIEGAGVNTWEKLLLHFPSLTALQHATVDEVAAIDGFAERSAQQIVEGLRQKRQLVKLLLELGIEPQAPMPKIAGDGPLSGKTLVITGALSLPRKDIEAKIKAAGGQVSGSVSKHTAAVITNEDDSASSKMEKARQLGIPIWSEAELLRQLSQV